MCRKNVALRNKSKNVKNTDYGRGFENEKIAESVCGLKQSLADIGMEKVNQDWGGSIDIMKNQLAIVSEKLTSNPQCSRPSADSGYVQKEQPNGHSQKPIKKKLLKLI